MSERRCGKRVARGPSHCTAATAKCRKMYEFHSQGRRRPEPETPIRGSRDGRRPDDPNSSLQLCARLRPPPTCSLCTCRVAVIGASGCHQESGWFANVLHPCRVGVSFSQFRRAVWWSFRLSNGGVGHDMCQHLKVRMHCDVGSLHVLFRTLHFIFRFESESVTLIHMRRSFATNAFRKLESGLFTQDGACLPLASASALFASACFAP